MSLLSVEEAQAIVTDVQVTNGGFSPEVQSGLPAAALKAFKNLQSIAGSSIIHVAEDLYDADTRFIFELIQNAEDNRYNFATGYGQEPSLHFTLHQDHITVDSNEDGFSEEDVRAICSIHHSSKKQVGGYIGHKGIGFKSVFKIAYKVCIQSGPFCFYFGHRRGESGLGMITPYILTPQSLPHGVRTRISLYLLAPDDLSTRENELKEIPDTLLLFLRKLRKLTIEIPTLQYRVSYKRHENTADRLVTLTKEDNGIEYQRFYHMEKAVLSDLPSHHSRQQQQETDLILAFPVDRSFNPVIERQYVYSFLPMRDEGFKFVIQSDFITQANRQGIHMCERNYAIRAKISSLFAQAVKHFCKHDKLAYEWLRYLPGPHIYDPFWAQLREMIMMELTSCEILLCANGVLKQPNALEYLSPQHCDSRGHPLLEDTTYGIYLSQSYRLQRYSETLRQLGVKKLSFTNFLNRLEPYLSGQSPRFLDPNLDDDWHTRLANMLLSGIERYRNRRSIRQRIESMSLIPSGHGVLFSSKAGIRFPDDSSGNAIPGDVINPVIERKALENQSRRKLYEELGVACCAPDLVVNYILKRYSRYGQVTLEQSVDHLNYLYKTSKKNETLNKLIFIMNQVKQPIYRAYPTFGMEVITDDLYFETSGDYGTKQIAETLRPSCITDDRTRFDINIINTAYIKSLPPGEISQGRTWEQWLEEVASVRRIPRLKSPLYDTPSALAHLLQECAPMMLIGILKLNWEHYQDELTPRVLQSLRTMPVPCRNGKKEVKLCDTYYPSSEMQKLCSDLSIEDKLGLFLDIPANLAPGGTDGWEFLTTLGVSLKADIRFFSTSLRHHLQRIQGAATDESAAAAVFMIYRELATRFSEQVDQLYSGIFDKARSVILPTASGTMKTVSLDECVWGGHSCLRNCLSQYREYSDDRLIKSLFRDILNIQDAGIETYLTELEMRKADSQERQHAVPIRDVKIIYNKIVEMGVEPHDNILVARKRFDDSQLVYLPEERIWVAPRSCLWTEAPRIGSHFGISTLYPELEAFFKNVLQVQVPTVATYIGQLRSIISGDSVDIPKIKATLHKIDPLCSVSDDLKDLLDIGFLPVKGQDGQLKILKATDTFFISDRIEYQSAFGGKVPILDFSLEETQRLYRLLSLLGLEDRFMSRAVKVSTVVQGPSEESSSTETRVFRRKARHVYRVILHYQATNSTTEDHQWLRALQQSVVHAGSGFKKTLELQLNSIQVSVESDTGVVHIERRGEELRIFVPSSTRDRQLCYSRQLPQALARLFRLGDKASMMLQFVFTNEKDFIIEDSLDGNGISELPKNIEIPDDDLEEDSSLRDELQDDTTATEHAGSQAGDSENHNPHRSTPVSSPDVVDEVVRPVTTNFRASSPLPRPLGIPPSPPVHPREPSDQPYMQLLDKVIQGARELTLRGALQNSTTAVFNREYIDHESVFGSRSRDQLRHDIKIGAAGELFVFELLLSHGLPYFSHENWRSTIRKNVIVHPEYSDLAPWNGFETSDLIYQDHNSSLTRLLLNTGYLTFTSQAINPTYYIEVKTTTGECDNAFYTSKSQYERMERMRIDHSSPGNEIYVVFRVYNLGKNGMGVKLYVDPESLRQSNELVFTPESYSVRPGLPR